MNEAFLLTGGNIGNRQLNLQKAANAIAVEVGEIIKASSLYETAAWGKTDQSPFLNQVLQVQTKLSPQDLLSTLLSIELQLGRERLEKMGPRTIDLDVLFYNDAIINTNSLTVPHPQIPFRRFVLTPLNEIASDYIHPALLKSIASLLKECPDKLEVVKLK